MAEADDEQENGGVAVQDKGQADELVDADGASLVVG